MGLFSAIGSIGKSISSFVGNLFGGSSGNSSSSSGSYSSNTTYEPDKVKIAEIERDLKIELAHLEKEKIEMIKNAKIEVLENEYHFKMAYEQAKAKGLTCTMELILSFQDKLNEITEKRIEIIEKCSLNIIKDIENFYIELGEKIQQDDMDYNINKLPMLLSTMEKFDENSDSYKMYKDMIEKNISAHSTFVQNQMNSVLDRQNQVINGFLKSKETIIEKTTQITNDIVNDRIIGSFDSLKIDNDNNLVENLNEEFLLENTGL